MSEDMEKRVGDALDQSRKTGKSVNIPLNTAKERQKRRWGNKKEVDRKKLDGDGIAEIIQNRDKTMLPAGFFKITEKKLNEETDLYEYKFEWNEKFGNYAAQVCNREEGLTPEEMDIFCFNLLVAQQTEQLEDGVKIEHLNKEREKETKSVKFYKKYK